MPWLRRTCGLLLPVAVCLAAADDLAIDWNRGSMWRGSGLFLRLGAALEVTAANYNPDPTRFDDRIRERWAWITQGDDPFTVHDRGVAEGDRYDRGYDPGIKLNTANLTLGGAWRGLRFGFTAAGASGTLRLSNWYLGLSGVPAIGTITVGRGSTSQSVGRGAVVTSNLDTWNNAKGLTGIHLGNRWFKGRLGYQFSAGIVGPVQGTTNGNWDLQMTIFGEPLRRGRTGVKLQVFAAVHHPAQRANDPSSARFSAGGGPELARGQVISITARGQQVWQGQASGSLVHGPVGAGASLGGAWSRAGDEGSDTEDLLQAVVAGRRDWRLTLEHDGRYHHLASWVGWTLTGERQRHGGGIGRPRRPFRLDGPGWGAVELAARYVYTDLQANVRDRVFVPLEAAVEGWIEAMRENSANRSEGGIGEEYAVGLNWYLTPNLVLSAYAARLDWQYDHAVVGNPGFLARSWVLPAAVPEDEALVALLQQGLVANNYRVDSWWVRARVVF